MKASSFGKLRKNTSLNDGVTVSDFIALLITLTFKSVTYWHCFRMVLVSFTYLLIFVVIEFAHEEFESPNQPGIGLR